MKIKSLISAVILIIMPLVFMPGAKAETATYYLGDAIMFNGQVIIGSTNLSGGLELLKLSGQNIIRTAQINWMKNTYSESGTFYGFTFSAEQEKLYVYLVDGRYLFKYDISNLSAPVLIFQIRDNGWDYFMGVERVNDNIITFGIKGTKVWNLAGQIINGFNLINKSAYSINFSTGDLIVSADNGNLKIFDKNNRQLINQVSFLVNEDNNRKTFIDTAAKAIYFVDDGSLKKLNYSGNQQNIFKHISNRGYDVDGLTGKNHLYFTDGLGIVKFNKLDLKPMKWAYTTDLGESNGWAMGLKVLADGNGEKIVIFNNSAILVLDQDLKMVSHLKAAAGDTQPPENLFLRLDKNRAAANSLVAISGGGYAAGEGLIITLAGQNYQALADSQGRFVKTITVPAVNPVKTDLKVTGKISGLSYSASFAIEQAN